MRKRISALFVLLMCLICINTMTVFGADNRITSYAFAGIAGSIQGETITVNVPYSTVTTYWNHKVDVSEGAYFTAGTITLLDDKHSTGEIIVYSKDGTPRKYKVNINKNNFMPPTYSVGKATSIKKNGAKIKVEIQKNDAKIRYIKLVYYTKKNNSTYRSLSGEGEIEVELTGLQQGTKYYYYLEIQAEDKTYTTSAKSFTTKKASDTGTSSSTSQNTSNTNNKNTNNKGTNSTSTGTNAKQDSTARNEWKLVNGKWYYFGADGFSKVGWFQVGDKWYYVVKATNDLVVNQWKKISGVWYYFDASGAMLANSWIKDEGLWYWMGPSGSMLTNQEIIVDGRTYLLSPDGSVMSNVWTTKDGRWQYHKPDGGGLARNEDFNYDGTVYHADANGYVQ